MTNEMLTQNGTDEAKPEPQTLSPPQTFEASALEGETNVNIVTSSPELSLSDEEKEKEISQEQEPPKIFQAAPVIDDDDIRAFQDGTHLRLYEKLGAHPAGVHGVGGTQFAVWAPNAECVNVVGDFNQWDRKGTPLKLHGNTGIWEGFARGAKSGECYKYFIRSRYHEYEVEKADPFAFRSEIAPKNASIIWELDYHWGDEQWMQERARRNALDAPISIYEVHAGSWMRAAEQNNRWLTYRELAEKLAAYCKEMGFTHVEFLPLMEHPLYRSWGYQTTGYFAPTSRYGSPQDLMFLVDYLHQQGIGVFLDWVPSHFPTDAHGLARFDGTYLYEHADPRKGYHPDWKTSIFNYGRHEVCSFLLSSALFWLEKYHVDGLRVDAVASMLYLDYSRKPGEWVPNRHGGNANLEAIEFLRHLNKMVYREHPDVQMIAEESTAWAQVSRPTSSGGLGFGLKWDMGWMHDTLRYMKRSTAHRKFHQGELPFRMVYAFRENFVLPLSHDEVVHGKGSLYGMMPGDEWQKYANLRLLFGYMFASPGKKLLFMGDEIAQWPEWKHDASIEWDVLNDRYHSGVQKWVRDLNHLYQAEPALHDRDFSPDGFEWVDFGDSNYSTLFFLRRNRDATRWVLAAFNFTPVPRHNYRVGVARPGYWKELLNSDAQFYGGSGQGNGGGAEASNIRWHHRPHSLSLTLPPLGALLLHHRDGS
jgi:1,4-alpha-glucan branching enzyme